MKPKFTDEENYVLAYYRDEKISSASRANCLDSARVLVAAGMFANGVIGGDVTWAVIGFAVLLYGNIRGMFENARYTRVFRGIFAKYAEAVKPE